MPSPLTPARTAICALSCCLLLAVSTAYGQLADTPSLSASFLHRSRAVHWNEGLIIHSPPVPEGRFAFSRHLSRAAMRWEPGWGVRLDAAVANEFRHYLHPEREFSWDELFIDALSLQWSDTLGLPLRAVAGRQNLRFGEGFVMMDGTPLDGSRSTYFNALRLDVRIAPSTVTAFAALQQDVDDLLPVINSREQLLLEQPAHAYGLYAVSPVGDAELQSYVLGRRAKRNARVQNDVHTIMLGARLHQPFARHWALTAEGGWQGGEISADEHSSQRSAWGGYAYCRWKAADEADASMHLLYLDAGIVLLSGDRENTAAREDWDPMFGRWPKWSESWIYAIGWEDGVAGWTNTSALFLRGRARLYGDLALDVCYFRLGALQHPADSENKPYGKGLHRGDLLTARAGGRLGAGFSGHLLLETLFRGRYYEPVAEKDGDTFWSYQWMRLELRYDLSGAVVR